MIRLSRLSFHIAEACDSGADYSRSLKLVTFSSLDVVASVVFAFGRIVYDQPCSQPRPTFCISIDAFDE